MPVEAAALAVVPAVATSAIKLTQTVYELKQAAEETRALLNTVESTKKDIFRARNLRQVYAHYANSDDLASYDQAVRSVEEGLADLERVVERARIDYESEKGKIGARARFLWVVRDSTRRSALSDQLTFAYVGMQGEMTRAKQEIWNRRFMKCLTIKEEWEGEDNEVKMLTSNAVNNDIVKREQDLPPYENNHRPRPQEFRYDRERVDTERRRISMPLPIPPHDNIEHQTIATQRGALLGNYETRPGQSQQRRSSLHVATSTAQHPTQMMQRHNSDTSSRRSNVQTGLYPHTRSTSVPPPPLPPTATPFGVEHKAVQFSLHDATIPVSTRRTVSTEISPNGSRSNSPSLRTFTRDMVPQPLQMRSQTHREPPIPPTSPYNRTPGPFHNQLMNAAAGLATPTTASSIADGHSSAPFDQRRSRSHNDNHRTHRPPDYQAPDMSYAPLSAPTSPSALQSRPSQRHPLLRMPEPFPSLDNHDDKTNRVINTVTPIDQPSQLKRSTGLARPRHKPSKTTLHQSEADRQRAKERRRERQLRASASASASAGKMDDDNNNDNDNDNDKNEKGNDRARKTEESRRDMSYFPSA